jgi:TonB family protein
MKKLFALVAAISIALPIYGATISAPSVQDVRFAQNTNTDGLVIPPMAVTHPAAEYTMLAFTSKVEGNVIVQAHFDENGNINSLKIVRGLGYGLDENAMSALLNWRFAPALQNGLPVTAVAEVEVPFKLSSVNELQLIHRAAERNRQIRCARHPDLWPACRK